MTTTEETQVEGRETKVEGQTIQSRIDAIHAHAAAMQRPITPSEMDEIDDLSKALQEEKRAWLDSRLPMPATA